MEQNYNNTLNLPRTDFPMRANLVNMEQEKLAKWESDKIYEKLMSNNASKPLFVLHDGPPYANGDIHLGTALNKILKDFIIRYKNMSGNLAPYIPGWDTHGLPTELKARKKTRSENISNMSAIELRKLCKEFVLNYINNQRDQFKRLGGLGDWEHPYITLQKEFEAEQIEIFAQMACKGYIYRGLKPVYWCPDCKTALAEAEIEYEEDSCTSAYVRFPILDDKKKFSSLGIDLKKTSFVIWTTTIWTLPANVAICLGANFDYSVVSCNGEYLIMAKGLIPEVLKLVNCDKYEIIATFKGKDLELMKASHPFLDRESLVIVGDHVTLESGTGCVHTAPGHGLEDYQVSLDYPQLEIVVPVDANGKLTDLAGDFSNLSTAEANLEIAKYLEKNGLMFAKKEISHQYPHCWRCKKPVIFRATEQWFCSIDSFKEDAIKEINKVEWKPSWGKERISNMVRSRKDWCISRQRRWGVPIPIFFCKECGEALIDYNIMHNVAEMFREHGSDYWFETEAEEILPKNTSCKKCSCTEFVKEKDIMDVWFDSGVTHAAVLEKRSELSKPADLYLEGADQYRGWFQSSLLTSVATSGKAPYKTVVTHGWVVDGQGRKMSKSLGNGINPQKVVNKYGADILRLWVASSDYHADIRISDDILKQLSEAYRKIRNTARFILGNISDFDPNKDEIATKDMEELDVWAIVKLNEMNQEVHEAYREYEFHKVFHSIHDFCVVDMSNFYLDIIKDRLYVEAKNSQSRKSAQTAIYKILDTLVRLVSPILPYTADQIWEYMPHKNTDNTDNIVLNDMNTPVELVSVVSESFTNKWEKICKLREDIQKALEIARENKIIGKSLEAKVKIFVSDEANEGNEMYDFLVSCKNDLKMVSIVSGVEIEKSTGGDYTSENFASLSFSVEKSNDEKCERCWMHDETVGKDLEHPTLCSRCAKIVREANI